MKKFLTIDDLIEFCMKNNFSKFSSKESNAEISVQMPAVATFGKSDDDKHTEGLCPFNATAYHDHVNLNKSNINEDTFQENTQSIPYRPILANIVENSDGNKDFGSHDFTVETDENGDTIVARAKTREELPYLNVKWFKTYTSMDAAVKSLTEENNWGDGAIENPQKDVLNTALYEAEKVIKGFENYAGDADAAYAALKNVHADADVVYNKSDATTEEYLSAIENINAAIAEFYSYVNPSENLVYNYIRTSDAATSLYAAQSEVTKDNYTGRPLALGANESAIPLTFVPIGVSNGQCAYNLKGKDGVVVQCTDGTLQLTHLPTATVTGCST